MAIGTGATILFHGTQDEVTTAPATVADNAFSIASDTSEWANDDDAPFAMFLLQLTAAGLGGVPDGGPINLYCQLVEVEQAADDTLFPSATFPHVYLGSFPTSTADEDQQSIIGPVKLPQLAASQKYVFVIENKCGQALGTSWQLWVTPLTYGPHA